ncbi:MAG: PatB family C-S lyase [Coriobacteriia bacterium]|nr:PatB family C-S lyase [Coriobacteriia bacterium]
MHYDFDTVYDRTTNKCLKYDLRKDNFGTDDVLPMWIADMDFKTAPEVIEACKARAEEGIWGYTSRPDSYWEALQDWEEKYYGWRPDVDKLSWCMGVVPAFAALLKINTMPGDKVLVQTPVYMEFRDIPEMIGRRVVCSRMIENEDGTWSTDWEDFEAKAKECKAFILCNPQNPLGIVWTPEELTRFTQICMDNNLLMISDEIHSDLTFHGKKTTRVATLSDEIKNYVVTCTALSKTFNLAGMQCASIIFPNTKMKRDFDDYWVAMDILRNNAFSVVATETAYREGHGWLAQLKQYVSDNFDYVNDFCAQNLPQVKPNRPDATYLMWIDFRGLGMSNEELSEFMIKKAKLGLSAGWAFDHDLSGFMRMNVACPRATVEKAMAQLKAAVDEL